MQIIYNYKYKKIYISRVQNISATLWLQYVVGLHVMLLSVLNVSYFYTSTFRCTCAVLSLAVFCSFLMS